MRTFRTLAVVLVVLAIFATAAEPVQQSLPEGATVKLLLLRQKSVQKELEVTPEAAQKITAFTNAQADAAGKALEQGEAARKEAFGKLRKQNEQFLTDTLTPKQNKRLDQITMQFTALTHLTKAEIIRDLKLSDEQVKKLKDHHVEARKAAEELIAAKERAGKTEKLAKLRADTRTKIMVILTDEQKAKVRELVGAPFEGEIVIEEP